MNIYRKIFAVVLLTVLLFFAVINIGDLDSLKKGEIHNAEKINNIYGGINRFVQKNEINEFSIAKDKKGYLQYTDFGKKSTTLDALEYARRIRNLQDAVAEKGTKVIFLMYPSRYVEGVDEGYAGIPYLDQNELADDLLMYLRRYNIDYIDYRKLMADEKGSYEYLMYKTDEHWKFEYAFEALKFFANHMKEKYEVDFDPNNFYLNPDNYNINILSNNAIGNLGAEAGTGYLEGDTVKYYTPKYETKFERTISRDIHITYSGSFEEVFIRKNESDFYSMIGGSDNKDRISNFSNLNGIGDEIDIVFIGDSFMTPMAVYLTPMVNRVNIYNSAYCGTGYFEQYFKNYGADYVIIAFSASELKKENIPFYPTEESEEKADES